MEIIRLPPKSPNLNAYAERFERSIKDECLNRMIFIGEASLRRAVREFMAHYHAERNHQGLGNRLIGAERPPFHRIVRWHAEFLPSHGRVRRSVLALDHTRCTNARAISSSAPSDAIEINHSAVSARLASRPTNGNPKRRSG